MSSRSRISETRSSVTRKFSLPWDKSIGGSLEIYVTVGMYENGNPGELFLTANKPGDMIRGLFDALAMSVSIALQHGVPIGAIVRQWKNMNFGPGGLTGDEGYPIASSILDYIATWILMRFGDVGGGK